MRLWWWGLLVLSSDQLSKWYFPAVVTNSGSAFGVGVGWAWEVVTLLVLGGLGYLLMWSDKVGERVALTLILVGGVSNFIDRILLGGVRDFIYWPILNVYGNVADIFIVMGAGSVLWSLALPGFKAVR